ncbi:PREDICTED: uncharacterized protein LOC108569588 [Nicrophorus vespilloides]|uniref:Uncharacterized protein LOC108569588 n=1 Tax=Nicrophorus vespilloides TaxID=110193 RepID=A0ABM1NIN0_NICVS|nr:PREDICTED: uncharacterized protein LOC108569588 [Nicrophorus vespilloides]
MASRFVTVLSILLVINSALALECYVCDSSKSVTCKYSLLSFMQDSQKCNIGSSDGFLGSIASIIPTNCVKLVGKDHNGNEYVSRGCAPSTGPINSCNAIAKAIMTFSDTQELAALDCYTCNTDKCNSATKIGGMTIFGLLAACILFLF